MSQDGKDQALAGQRIVVVGSSGFVGAEISAMASAQGAEVIGLGRANGMELLTAEGATVLRQAVQPGDTVVFVSAKAPCKDYQMFEENILIAKNALDALSGIDLSYFLYISSDAVYSDSDTPLTEQSVTAPDNLHGQMHASREVMFQASLPDTVFGSLRPTLIYGQSDPHNGYGPNRFRRLVQTGEAIKLFGQGEERRDHVCVKDVATLAGLMIAARHPGAMNAATGRVASFMELAELTNSFSDAPVPIESLPRSGPMPHGGYRPFDPSGVAKTFPDFSFTPLEDGLRAAFNGDPD